jgi:hypothetical protein
MCVNNQLAIGGIGGCRATNHASRQAVAVNEFDKTVTDDWLSDGGK